MQCKPIATTKEFIMRNKTILGMAAALVLGTFGIASAQASVVSSNSSTSFADNIYTLNIANGAASYSFQNSMDGTYFVDAAIKTGGSALVGANSAFFGGTPAAFVTRNPFTVDANLPNTELDTFEKFNSFTIIPYSSTDSYLALAFDLADGRHYGYAEIAGTNFLGYGYETVAGKGIVTGAVAPTRVPEPGSLVMLAFGLALVGAGTATARRRKS